jgi:hypothetical protein
LFDFGRGQKKSVLHASSREFNDIEYGVFKIQFTIAPCHLYTFQVNLELSVKLWRHARPNSSNKVPFAPKYG